MNIAICDDQDICHIHLSKILTEYVNCAKIVDSKIQTYDNGAVLLKEYLPGKFDFVFLDVDMPELDGFGTAEQIRKLDLDVNIIFVTKMADQIEQGYRYNAKAYLSKPVTTQAINNLMDRLLEERSRRKHDNSRYTVKLKGSGAEIELCLGEIIYFESNLHYVVATTTGDSFTFYGQLTQLETDLESNGFVRVHQSYLVNMKYIFAFVNNQVVFVGDIAKIPLSRKYKESAKVIYDEYRSR